VNELISDVAISSHTLMRTRTMLTVHIQVHAHARTHITDVQVITGDDDRS